MRRTILLLLFAAASASAQTSATIDVSIVNVDVVVADKEGNRVHGLTADDFEIYENGKRQAITNFAEYADEAPPALDASAGIESPAAAERPAAQKRTILLFAEGFVVQPYDAKPLFAKLRETLKQVVRPGDSVAVVSWLNALVIRQDFTDDLRAIERALAALEQASTGDPDNSALRAIQERAVEAIFESPLAAQTFREMTERMDHAVDPLDKALRQRFRIRQKALALNALMQRMSTFEGKKVVIMAMRRFGEYAGAEYFGGSVPNQYRPMLETQSIRDLVTTTANANGITIYPIHPEGLAKNHRNSAEGPAFVDRGSDQELVALAADNNTLLNETKALDDVAQQTGGSMQWSSKEIAAMLPRIAEDLLSYYSLAYRASNASRRAKLEVKTKNRDYVVRARREVVEKTDDEKMRDRVVARLYQPVTGATIPITASLGAFQKKSAGRWLVPLHVRIPIGSLTMLEDARAASGAFSVYVAPGAVYGLASDVQQRKQQFSIERAKLARAKESFFTYDFTVEVDAVADRVAVAVFDETAKEYGLVLVKLPPRTPGR